ncbi:hypothetical protein GBA52_013912 [Prunus armeniaca]|nr:hypothetical protein GBA52_013912 [Prunus armeniaca]
MEPEDNSTNHIPGIQLTPLEPFDNSVSMIDGGHSAQMTMQKMLPQVLCFLSLLILKEDEKTDHLPV